MILELVAATIAVLVLACCASDPSLLSPGRPTGDAPHASAVVRYQVADVERAIAFYTATLGFRLEQKAGAAFASVRLDGLRLLLSGPGSSGSRPMPDGRRQEPGGWNRIVLDVDDLQARIAALRTAGVRFRNDVETGPGGSQVQIEDPDGNAIELHQPPAEAAQGR